MWCVVSLRPFQVRGREAVGGFSACTADTAMWRVVLSHPVLSCVVESHKDSCLSLIRSSGVLKMCAHITLVPACEGT